MAKAACSAAQLIKTLPYVIQPQDLIRQAMAVQEDMIFKGVVFNEMKGVYSSPDSTNSRLTQSALFPDNTYAVDSGGDPSVIPELSFDEFRAFHARYYHPSNARFWFYGDDDPEQRLQLMDRALQGFNARPVDSTVGTQSLFKASTVLSA